MSDKECLMNSGTGAKLITSQGSFSLEHFLHGHDYWRSYRAISEIEIYCVLLEKLQDRIDSLVTRGREEETALRNVQAVMSSYALEVALKSFWALDHPTEEVPHTHKLSRIFGGYKGKKEEYDGLKEETKTSLAQYNLVGELFDRFPDPFYTNRYSMEGNGRKFVTYPVDFLRSLNVALKEKLEESTGWQGISNAIKGGKSSK